MGNQHVNKNKPAFWTDENVRILREKREAGKSFGVIGREMGITANSALSAFNNKVLKKKFPSRYKKKDTSSFSSPREDVVEHKKPTLPWVPGISNGGKYKLGTFKYD